MTITGRAIPMWMTISFIVLVWRCTPIWCLSKLVFQNLMLHLTQKQRRLVKTRIVQRFRFLLKKKKVDFEIYKF